MSQDYSFMKTGHSMLVSEQTNISQQEEENILSMLAMFTSNAMINSQK